LAFAKHFPLDLILIPKPRSRRPQQASRQRRQDHQAQPRSGASRDEVDHQSARPRSQT